MTCPVTQAELADTVRSISFIHFWTLTVFSPLLILHLYSTTVDFKSRKQDVIEVQMSSFSLRGSTLSRKKIWSYFQVLNMHLAAFHWNSQYDVQTVVHASKGNHH